MKKFEGIQTSLDPHFGSLRMIEKTWHLISWLNMTEPVSTRFFEHA